MTTDKTTDPARECAEEIDDHGAFGNEHIDQRIPKVAAIIRRHFPYSDVVAEPPVAPIAQTMEGRPVYLKEQVIVRADLEVESDLAALRAENARLREALEGIVQQDTACPLEWSMPTCYQAAVRWVSEFKGIARAALGEQ